MVSNYCQFLQLLKSPPNNLKYHIINFSIFIGWNDVFGHSYSWLSNFNQNTNRLVSGDGTPKTQTDIWCHFLSFLCQSSHIWIDYFNHGSYQFFFFIINFHPLHIQIVHISQNLWESSLLFNCTKLLLRDLMKIKYKFSLQAQLI